jgi:hypothetical protein
VHRDDHRLFLARGFGRRVGGYTNS